MLLRTQRAKVVEFVDRWDARLDRSYLRWRDRKEKRSRRPSDPPLATPSQPDWPWTRWKLTAPECYQLCYAGDGLAITTFSLAVKELIASRALRVTPVELDGRRLWDKEPAALAQGPYAGITSESPLAPVLALFARTPKRTLQAADGSLRGTRWFEGVLIKDFVKAGRKEFGRFYGYRDQQVFGALTARGLMTTGRGLDQNLRKRRMWTDTGREAADELEQWLRIGKERLGEWVSEDPQLAFAYTSGAGATILLMDDLDPEFALLARHLLPGLRAS